MSDRRKAIKVREQVRVWPHTYEKLVRIGEATGWKVNATIDALANHFIAGGFMEQRADFPRPTLPDHDAKPPRRPRDRAATPQPA